MRNSATSRLRCLVITYECGLLDYPGDLRQLFSGFSREPFPKDSVTFRSHVLCVKQRFNDVLILDAQTSSIDRRANALERLSNSLPVTTVADKPS